MKKRPWVVIAILAILVLLALLFWWFWSLGNPPQTVVPKLQLAIEKGEVFITPNGGQMMEKATSGMELHSGDRLKTADNSAASIMAYGQADMRLDQDTELTIKQVSDQDDASLVLRWQLQSGRVWSRVLRLLDLDSTYEGQANQVIATVRGTAFGMETDGQKVGLFVGHAGIRSAGIQAPDQKFMVGGHWAIFDTKGGIKEQGDVTSSTWRDDPWIRANQEADVKYAAAAAAALIQRLGAQAGTPPDSWAYGLSQWSEKLHLSLAGKQASVLMAEYTGRRLGYVHDLIQRGKSGLAFQVLTGIESDIQSALAGSQATDYRTRLKPVLGHILLGVSEVNPDSAFYRYKIRIEDMYALAWSDDAAQTFYARALSVDARLDEAERFDCSTQDQDKVREAVNAVEQGLAREKNDWDKLQSGLSDTQRQVISEKMEVQNLRLAFLNQRLAACSLPPPTANPDTNATSTAMATSTAATTSTRLKTSNTDDERVTLPPSEKPPAEQDPPPSQTPPEPTSPSDQADLGLTRIELLAQPNPANVGERVNLTVKGHRQDGSSLDVTPSATFQVIGGLGDITGNIYRSSKPGSVTIMATIVDNGQRLTASVPLAINQAVSLSSISISPAGGTLVYGESRNLSVMAHYTNGFSQDVTSSVKWSLSNTLARIAGSTVTANEQPGTVTVTATYTEGGSTQTASVDFQVTNSQTTSLR